VRRRAVRAAPTQTEPAGQGAATLQLGSQLPPKQRPPSRQAAPQLPQLVGSLSKSTQAFPQHIPRAVPPSSAQAWSMAVVPAQLPSAQPPPMHTSPAGQAAPQAPQLWASLVRSAQPALQQVCSPRKKPAS
jgi:hypothetical protein